MSQFRANLTRTMDFCNEIVINIFELCESYEEQVALGRTCRALRRIFLAIRIPKITFYRHNKNHSPIPITYDIIDLKRSSYEVIFHPIHDTHKLIRRKLKYNNQVSYCKAPDSKGSIYYDKQSREFFRKRLKYTNRGIPYYNQYNKRVYCNPQELKINTHRPELKMITHVTFDSKHGKNGESVTRKLEYNEEGTPYCKAPDSNRLIRCITNRKLKNLNKSTCDKCKTLQYRTSCSTIDNCCGIDNCSRNIGEHEIYKFNGQNRVHWHNLCEKCFDQIPKNIWVKLIIDAMIIFGGNHYKITSQYIQKTLLNQCRKCNLTKNCVTYTIINGCCGIPTCRYDHIPHSEIFSFTGKKHVHYHSLCEDCFDQIPKEIWVNLHINNSWQWDNTPHDSWFYNTLRGIRNSQ